MAESKDTHIRTEEESVTSHDGWAGGKPPPRDKRPEAQYPQHDRDQGVNRTDDAAPRGPVNIGVKGNDEKAGPDAAVKETPQATGGGSRDSTAGLPQE